MEKLEIKDGYAIARVNPKIYPLAVIYSAAYVFLDRAYILLDGDPEKEVTVELKPRKGEDPEKLANEFFNELINYADYSIRAEQTKKIRETILQRALITNDPSVIENNKEFESMLDESDEDEDYLDDPEDIAIPWEEKYGDKKDENKTE